jgi:hypothetical protein
MPGPLPQEGTHRGPLRLPSLNPTPCTGRSLFCFFFRAVLWPLLHARLMALDTTHTTYATPSHTSRHSHIARPHLGHCRHVSLCQIHYMNVVADGCAVWGGVVAPEHAQILTLPQCHLHSARQCTETHRQSRQAEQRKLGQLVHTIPRRVLAHGMGFMGGEGRFRIPSANLTKAITLRARHWVSA